MKSLRMMLLAAVLALTGTAQADNLAVGSVTMVPGQTKEVAVSLENPQQAYTAFQLELVLPEGVTMVRDAQGRLMARLDDGRKADHVLNAADKGGGVCRLMSFSLSNAAYGGQEGPLVYVVVEAAADAPSGELTATLRSPVFTQADGTQVKWADVSFAITVGGEVIAGDVNSDGRVDGLDVVTLARYLVGEDPVPFNAAAANVNGDERISIADVAGVIEISRSRNLEMAPSKYRNIEITKSRRSKSRNIEITK